MENDRLRGDRLRWGLFIMKRKESFTYIMMS